MSSPWPWGSGSLGSSFGLGSYTLLSDPPGRLTCLCESLPPSPWVGLTRCFPHFPALGGPFWTRPPPCPQTLESHPVPGHRRGFGNPCRSIPRPQGRIGTHTGTPRPPTLWGLPSHTAGSVSAHNPIVEELPHPASPTFLDLLSQRPFPKGNEFGWSPWGVL